MCEGLLTPFPSKKYGHGCDRASECKRCWLRDGGEEISRIAVTELLIVLFNLLQRRIEHPGARAIRTVEERQRAAKGAGLRIESQVDQHVIVEVHLTVAVEVTVQPTSEMVIEAVIRLHVIVEVHLAVEVRVAVIRVLHED